jgi:hypothetical protein
MNDVIVLVAALVTIGLGIRLAMKFREMARWNDEDRIVDGKPRSAVPTELRELKIDEPTEDGLNRLDGSENTGGSENHLTTDKT